MTLLLPSEKPTRREALGKMLLITAGASAGLLGASGLLVFLSQGHQAQSSANKRPSPSAQPASHAQLFLNIKVYYVGMANLIGTSMENLQISAPASLSELIAKVCQEHPAFQTMSSMQILLNGMAAQGNPILKNGDTVAIMTTMVGG
jgi:molybdopterin converting factor small subunit